MCLKQEKSKVITICGSLRFKDEMIKIALEMELAKNVVLLPIFPIDDTKKLTDTQLDILGRMHKEKIKISDEILVVNVNGYIGKSTNSEIEFARSLNKTIVYYENDEI